jgi:hypothetical protein
VFHHRAIAFSPSCHRDFIIVPSSSGGHAQWYIFINNVLTPHYAVLNIVNIVLMSDGQLLKTIVGKLPFK